MLFGVLYAPNGRTTEESQQRSLQLFTQWTPPFEFKAHYARGDGKGGIAIVESATAESVIEGVAPWAPFFDFDVTPVMDIAGAVPVMMRAMAWRSSVG